MNDAPVFIIDDDIDDLEMVQDIWPELNFGNGLQVFSSAEHLLAHLKNTGIDPFIIISDVNLHKTDGFELRQTLADDMSLRYKSVPFVFWSTVASNEQIKKAYDLGAHGFFLKGRTLNEIKASLNIIMTYWKTSKAPATSATRSRQ